MIIIANSGTSYKLDRLLAQGGFGLVYEAIKQRHYQLYNAVHQETPIVLKFVEQDQYNQNESMLNQAVRDKSNFAKLIEEWTCTVELPQGLESMDYHVFAFEKLGISLL